MPDKFESATLTLNPKQKFSVHTWKRIKCFASTLVRSEAAKTLECIFEHAHRSQLHLSVVYIHEGDTKEEVLILKCLNQAVIRKVQTIKARILKNEYFSWTGNEVELLLKVTIDYKTPRRSKMILNSLWSKLHSNNGRKLLLIRTIMTSAYSKSSGYELFSVHTNTASRRFQIVPLWRPYSKSSVFGGELFRIGPD